MQEDAKRNRYNLKHSSFGSLYKNRREDIFLLYQANEQHWLIEKNKNLMEQIFTSFEESEQFLKRNYEAWLVRDDQFVEYLMNVVKHNKF